MSSLCIKSSALFELEVCNDPFWLGDFEERKVMKTSDAFSFLLDPCCLSHLFLVCLTNRLDVHKYRCFIYSERVSNVSNSFMST